MFKFLKEMLSGSEGTVSSKRSIMFFFSLLFAYGFVSNHLTGKPIDETMKWQLFGLLIWLIAVVFGEQIPEIFTAWFGRKTTTIEKTETKTEEIKTGTEVTKTG